MKKQSAGVLLYRFIKNSMEIFLVHPGGPFWKNKDKGSWSIPKGEFKDDEDALDAAKREFCEETGSNISGQFIKFSPIKQKSGKLIFCWAVQGDIDKEEIRSNTFELEWPPHSGAKQEFPEIDKSGWFNVTKAKEKIIPAQAALIDELMEKVKEKGAD